MESRHESPRSPARGHWERAGRVFLSGPHPRARATTVRRMGWCRQRTRSGRPFRGYHRHCPRPWEREERRRRGWGIGERCTNRRNAQSRSPRRPRPLRDLTTRAPAPAREPCGRSNTIFLSGEGRSPPRPPRSGAWDGGGEGHSRGRHPGPALSGAIACTTPNPRRVESGGERYTGRRNARSRPAPPPTPTHGRAAPHPHQEPAERPSAHPPPSGRTRTLFTVA